MNVLQERRACDSGSDDAFGIPALFTKKYTITGDDTLGSSRTPAQCDDFSTTGSGRISGVRRPFERSIWVPRTLSVYRYVADRKQWIDQNDSPLMVDPVWVRVARIHE